MHPAKAGRHTDPPAPRLTVEMPNGVTLRLEMRRAGRGAGVGDDRNSGTLRCSGWPLNLQVYLHRETIDFRIGINGLAILVEQAMHLDPFGRSVFAFCNRRRDRIRLLFSDRPGFWLLMKRLEVDRRLAAGQQQAVVRLSTEQLHWLLDGIDIEAVRRHPARQYLSVG